MNALLKDISAKYYELATRVLFSAHLKKMEMDGIVSFLQERLAVDFGTDDDLVIDQLKVRILNDTENYLNCTAVEYIGF